MSAPTAKQPGLPEQITSPARSLRFARVSSRSASSSSTAADRMFSCRCGVSSASRAMSGCGKVSEVVRVKGSRIVFGTVFMDFRRVGQARERRRPTNSKAHQFKGPPILFRAPTAKVRDDGNRILVGLRSAHLPRIQLWTRGAHPTKTKRPGRRKPHSGGPPLGPSPSHSARYGLAGPTLRKSSCETTHHPGTSPGPQVAVRVRPGSRTEPCLGFSPPVSASSDAAC